jgi:uncharacterized protein with ParB-like and HNH nuclease domain
VEKLGKGEFLIPSFQREFIWRPDDIIKLWDSIYRFYPIGSILYWTTPLRLHIHRRLGGMILFENGDDPHEKGERVYILDGQQRATSLLVSLRGSETEVTGRGTFDFSLYFDATSAAFFFKEELNRRRRRVNQAFLIRLADAMEKDSVVDPGIENEPGYRRETGENIFRLQRVFRDYNLSFISLTGFDVPAVREIFERINQEGKDLSSMDLMIARTFRNYAYVVEEDF